MKTKHHYRYPGELARGGSFSIGTYNELQAEIVLARQRGDLDPEEANQLLSQLFARTYGLELPDDDGGLLKELADMWRAARLPEWSAKLRSGAATSGAATKPQGKPATLPQSREAAKRSLAPKQPTPRARTARRKDACVPLSDLHPRFGDDGPISEEEFSEMLQALLSHWADGEIDHEELRIQVRLLLDRLPDDEATPETLMAEILINEGFIAFMQARHQRRMQWVEFLESQVEKHKSEVESLHLKAALRDGLRSRHLH